MRTDPRIAGAVAQMLDDPGRATRNAAEQCLLKRDPCSVTAILASTLRLGRNKAKRAAARLLGACRTVNTVGTLIGVLSDPSRTVRSAAVEALGRTGLPDAVDPIVNALMADESLRLTAIRALGRIDAEPAAKALYSELVGARARHREAAEALAKQGARSVPLLISALSHTDIAVRRTAASALGSTKSLDAVSALLHAWTDSDPILRENATASLAAVGPEAVDQVAAQLNAQDCYRRWKAAWVLGGIDHPRTAPLLVNVLPDPCRELRYAAIVSLGRKNAPEAVPHLIELLKDTDPGIRFAAAAALFRITGDKRSESNLREQ